MSIRNLSVFNPDNDLALANGDENYMAPASARQMMLDLALLPVWYGDADDYVLAPSSHNLIFLQEMRKQFSLSTELITEPELAAAQALRLVPWGWNVALRKRFLQLGIEKEALPTPEYLAWLTRCSHRSLAVELLARIRLNANFCGESFYLTQLDDVKAFVESRPTSLLKAPLSGSGKGLNWCKGVFSASIGSWCARVLARQGGVVAEPLYEKVEDFAMEFFSDGEGSVAFVGYSLFRTSGSGAYEGNYLASDEAIKHRLSQYVALSDLEQLCIRLAEELSAKIGSVYGGYLGVDMMICAFTDAPCFRIHPCVEVNLRMNMGIVARRFYDRYVQPEKTGTFCIDYTAIQGEALTIHREKLRLHPLRVIQGRVLSGYLSLTPVTRQTSYSAWVLIE
ncbi:hypothetical protein [uncultured Bacteroides sp.]|uniref:hypothetical protein n=1 Tax=uncultured Bacteroides sp. TaxID=162156 RepID=UPI002AA82D2C|nr:hypothetical protein [uncultured Bacteroides sp.]